MFWDIFIREHALSSSEIQKVAYGVILTPTVVFFYVISNTAQIRPSYKNKIPCFHQLGIDISQKETLIRRFNSLQKIFPWKKKCIKSKFKGLWFSPLINLKK